MPQHCAKCGCEHNREGQCYCPSCHAIYQAQRNRRLVAIPDDMLTDEQRSWLDRKRQGRRRVSREITHEMKAG